MKRLFLLLSIAGICELQAQTGFTLSSPSGRLRTIVAAGEELTYDLALDGRTVMEPSALALELDDGTVCPIPRPSIVRPKCMTGTTP